MKISDYSKHDLRKSISTTGLSIKIGPFVINLRSTIPEVLEHVRFFYGEYESPSEEGFFDHHIQLKKSGGLRRWIKPQVIFYHDEFSPFRPLPYDQAFAMFEWGLNWCIATTAHQYMIIHSAVIQKQGKAIIMPGMPGAGKSTLCAAMCLNDWNLLSDEMALLNPGSLKITPIPRPVSLKNQSIQVIGDFSPGAIFGPVVNNTLKGTVTHLRPSLQSIHDSDGASTACAIVFPKYVFGSETKITKKRKSAGLMAILENTFNAHVLGINGFSAAKHLIDECPIYNLEYSSLDEAMLVMEDILLKKDKKTDVSPTDY